MTTYINQISSLGPKVWYRFNETAGTPVNSGSLSTTSTFNNLLLNEQTDVDGRAIYLNGSNSYIQLPAHAQFALFNDRSFTVEAWVQILNTDTATNALEIFRLNAPSSPHYTVALFVNGNNANRGKVSLSSTWTSTITSTNAIDDGTWHHIVYTYNTSSVKLYIDGTLNASTTPTNLIASFNFDQSTKKLIGAGYTGISQASTANYFKGRIDEFAAYDYELTSTNILDNYNAGASVTFSTGVLGTASALMVEPTTSASFEPTAQAPMTASAASGDHYNSTVTFPKLLNTYMGELSLQSWFKFDQFRSLENYGTGSKAAAVWFGDVTNNIAGGIQGYGSISLKGATADNYIAQTTVVVAGVTQPTPMASQCQDEDFTIGFWVKKQTKEATGAFVEIYNTSSSESVQFRWNADGGITFRINANNTDHDIASTTDITDGEWHFITGQLASNTMELWIDNTSIDTETMNQGLTLTSSRFGGAGSTDYISLSQFFISTSAIVASTEIANLYDYGTPTFTEGAAYMASAAVKFDSAFNTYIQSKSPLFDFRIDEATGIPVNFGSADITMASDTDPQGYVVEAGLNNRAFKFTDRGQAIRGNFDLPSGTLSTSDTATLGVLFKTSWKTFPNIHAAMGSSPATAIGMYIQSLQNGTLRVFYGTGGGANSNLTGTTDFSDNKWHLAIAVADGTNLYLYVDGKLEASKAATIPFTDSNQFVIAGPALGVQNSNNTMIKYVDEAFATNTVFSAQEAFEAYQALRLEMDTTATALMVDPTTDMGTGNIYTAAPATASGLIVMPTEEQEVAPIIVPMNAHALFQHPNYGGNVVIDVNYGTEAFAADALFHPAGANIGENHIAIDMEASALMVHPTTFAGGNISVNPGIALNATLVDPGIVTIKGAIISTDAMRSNAIFPLPPAYIQLSDDPWFVRLLQGHSDRKSEFRQATLSSLPNQSSTDIIKGGFLSFFDDVLNSITQTTDPNTITSEIPNYYFEPIEDQQYDENGDLLPLDTSKAVARVTPSRGVLTPTPIVAPGYFDDQQRKAVRISNIEIPLPGTSTNFSIRPYNLEFSFKATKQNQVLAYGQFTSPSSTNSRKVGAVGLYNGKIYLAEDFYTPVSAFGEGGIRSLRVAGSVPHPINFTEETYVGYMLGNKNVADGQWHHIVIQRGYTDNRTQIWIDGVLDKQLGVQSNDGRSSGYANIPGSDASQEVRPYIIGFNSADANLSSDFETSAWNFYPGRFLEEREISLNSLAFIQADPIKPEPMLATAASTPNTKAAGNKARALLLYWWPVTRDGGSESTVSNDYGQFGPNDTPTFDKSIYTNDYDDQIPQDYYGWDIFPVSVTGYAGRLGGERSPFIKEGVLQSGGYYINPVTSAPRYLDVLNDIDLSAFDAIFFRNYPDQSEELDSYVREQYSDEYFNLKEKELYNDFIASLRAASDTGISLFITNAQLAIDLGIIEGYEEVPDLSSGEGDEYAPTIVPGGDGLDSSQGLFIDMHRNNRLRVVNTVAGLTNEPGYIWQDWAYFRGGIGENVDAFSGAPNRPFISLANKPNGLQVGDTFVISDGSWLDTYYEAVPFNKVKAGKIITAFANTYVNGTTVTDNPYKNFATTIALEPGTILNGKATVGKIFVNFTERLDRTTGAVSSVAGRGMRVTDGARDNFSVDLIQDEWINAAFNGGEISESVRDAYLAAGFNLDRRLEAEIAGQNRPSVIAEIQNLKYWDSNGLYILTQKSLIDDPTGALYQESATKGDGFGTGARRTRINKVRKDGTPTTGSVTSSLQWFSFTYSYQYLRAAIQVPSMLTRGFRWLSNKVVDDGTVIRTEVASAIASMPNHLGVGNKDNTVNAQAMLSLATIVHAPTYTLSDVLINTLPLTATGTFGQFAKNIIPDVLTGSALFKDPRIVSIQEDEVVLYINHVDPILYLREDVIK
jgi:hypothetical protein